MRFNKVIAIIRQKYGEISGFVTFARNIILPRASIKVKECYLTFPFLGSPPWYSLPHTVAKETQNLSQDRVGLWGIL